jgi:hypothetical protein
MERCELTCCRTTLPLLTHDERAAGDTFGLFMSLIKAPRGGLFGCQPEGRLALTASDHLDQLALDLARIEWARSAAMQDGAPWYGQAEGRSYLLVPCRHADTVWGVLYAEMMPTSPRIPAQHMATFSELLGQILRSRSAPDAPQAEPTPVALTADAERDNLVLLLERHEWNVSRVARLLGVTRMTIYNRLRRHRIAREHVRKSPPRRQQG